MKRSRKNNRTKRRHSIRKRSGVKMSRRNHNKRRQGGTMMSLPFRMKSSFLPECEAFHPTVYKSYGDVKNILLELQQRKPPITDNDQEAIQIARALYSNCNLLRKYMMFWDKSQAEIVEWYQLGPSVSGKRRIVDFIIKMYKKVPLSESLQQKWNSIYNPPNNYSSVQTADKNPFVIPQ